MAISIARPARSKRHLIFDISGFTLLEVMVAVAVIAIALIPLLRLHLLSLDATLYAQDLTIAVGLAQEKMAELTIIPETADDKLETGEQQGTFKGEVYKRFRWQTSVGEDEEVIIPTLDAKEDEELPTFNVRRLTVTVFWKDGNREKNYTLESYAVQ